MTRRTAAPLFEVVVSTRSEAYARMTPTVREVVKEMRARANLLTESGWLVSADLRGWADRLASDTEAGRAAIGAVDPLLAHLDAECNSHRALSADAYHVQQLPIAEAMHARAAELIALARRVARLNPDAGEIGAGMLASLVADAREIVGHD